MMDLLISLLLITLVNISAYIWAFKNQSDHLTDISYSLCFIVLSTCFLAYYGELSMGRVVFTLMVTLWGIRLGGFLFYRIRHMGRDVRFDTFRNSKQGFLKFWILQSISIWVIALPIMVGLQQTNLEVHPTALIIWTFGMLIEAIADWQKFVFRSQAKSSSTFIKHGLYTYLRHPNYLGEILIWISIFLYVTPILTGMWWLCIISPLWIIVLLIKISGIPLIENINKTKYNDNKEYEDYVNNTWRLIPYVY